MKNLFTTLLLIAFGSFAMAQGTVTGIVSDASNGDALIGASILVEGSSVGTVADIDGSFKLEAPAGSQTLVISFTGFAEKNVRIEVVEGKTNDVGQIELEETAIGLKEISVVASVAIDRKTPVAVSTIKAEEIERKLGNQEFPEILKSTPSIYTTKTGGGFGDARINVRGFAQEDVALLINGIPVNGMEDNKVYWSNWAGLGDVTRTIQVQRGLGASRLAVASVGGTINILTKTTDQQKGGAVFSSIGNDGYKKFGLTLSTGRTENGWAVTFSGSRTTGDGYIENTYIDAWNYFGSVAKEIGDNQQIMFTIFGAPQRHGQRSFWHPIDDQRDTYGKKWNDDFGYYQGQAFTFRENFYHKPQAALNHIWEINEKSTLITAAYASTGRGGGTGDLGGFVREDGAYRAREFRQAKDAYGHQQFDEFAKYNRGEENALYDTSLMSLTYAIGNGSERSGQVLSKQNGMFKRASMNEHEWYGLLSTYNQQLTPNLNLNFGVDLRWYHGSHYRKTIDLLGGDYWFEQDNINNQDDWVDLNNDGVRDANEFGKLVRPANDASTLFGSVDDDEKIDYANDEDINWYGAFAQLEYSADFGLSAFLSGAVNYTQMRRIDFFNKRPEENTTDWLNFTGGNVKAGANYNLNNNSNVFVNVGYISRAPYFDALFPTFNNDAANENAVNETVISFELGYGFRSSKFNANINAYRTSWQDKTQVETFFTADDVLFLNLLGVDALHSGVELDFNYRPVRALSVRGFASFNNWEWTNNPSGVVSDENQNVIGDATFYIDGLKVGDAAQTTMGIGADWRLGSGVSVDMQINHYNNLYASYAPDDRDDEATADVQALELPNFTLVDAGLSWTFDFGDFRATARANVNNLFDVEYVAEAADRIGSPGQSNADRLNDTRGWFGFGRTWNMGLKLHF